MRKLRKHFIGTGEVAGFIFNQIADLDNAYIYSVSYSSSPDKVDHYEVFKKQINKERTIVIDNNVIHYSEAERYPTASKFGLWAWSCKDLVSAIDTYKEKILKSVTRIT